MRNHISHSLFLHDIILKYVAAKFGVFDPEFQVIKMSSRVKKMGRTIVIILVQIQAQVPFENFRLTWINSTCYSSTQALRSKFFLSKNLTNSSNPLLVYFVDLTNLLQHSSKLAYLDKFVVFISQKSNGVSLIPIWICQHFVED